LRWLDLPRREGESDLIMAPVPAIGDDAGGAVGVYLKRLIARRAANEQIRLLYVAATRAKQSLYLSGAPKEKQDGTIVPRSGTLLASLWPALGAQFIKGDAVAEVEAPEPPVLALRRLEAGWSPPATSADVGVTHLPVGHQSLEPTEFSWVNETLRHVGTVVHAGLEAFAGELLTSEQIKSRREGFRQQLRRHGVPERELAGATELVVRALTNTVKDERGRWIFAPEHLEAHSELALTGIAGGRLTGVIIDRSFVDREGTRWVIDFKTSRHQGGGLEGFLEQELERYRAQLETYVALARGLGTQPVRAGLYFPLIGAFRELG
jgi:ATP-dependent exoDNAse (exonuclease V) beta subunit